MAGGRGTRLWPLSRKARPKQFLAFGEDNRSLLQRAVARAVALTGTIERVFVVGSQEHGELLQEQLPHLPHTNLLFEPEGRNTAACIAFAAFELRKINSDAVMLVLPADHLYLDERPWRETVRQAIDFAAEADYLVTIGLPPAEPSSAYGYIQVGEPLREATEGPVFRVARFVEKPDIETAQYYLESGEYFWNTGTFCWRIGVFLEALEKYLPGHYYTFKQVYDADAVANTDLTEIYRELENISVDYAIMEKALNVAVVQGNFVRIDLGNLLSIQALYETQPDENLLIGNVFAPDSNGNFVLGSDHSDVLTVLYGVSDLVVVHLDDVVLVTTRKHAGKIKTLLAHLRKSGFERFL